MKHYIFLALTFVISYAIGRIGHVLGGHLNAPHHWIYGLVAIIVGAIFRDRPWGYYLIVFGLGFVISDFKDMINLKFYGVDDVAVKKFWGID
jgi:hypothetical protein